MMLVGATGAILLGLPYIFHAFGPTEAEVGIWGWISLYLGVSLILLSVGFGRSTERTPRVFLSLGYTSLAFFQVFPILFWFAFHGSGVSDGTPPSAFVAHWFYSIPHAVLLVVSLLVLHLLWRFPTHSAAS